MWNDSLTWCCCDQRINCYTMPKPHPRTAFPARRWMLICSTLSRIINHSEPCYILNLIHSNSICMSPVSFWSTSLSLALPCHAFSWLVWHGSTYFPFLHCGLPQPSTWSCAIFPYWLNAALSCLPREMPTSHRILGQTIWDVSYSRRVWHALDLSPLKNLPESIHFFSLTFHPVHVGQAVHRFH